MVVLVNGILSVDSRGRLFLRRPDYRTHFWVQLSVLELRSLTIVSVVLALFLEKVIVFAELFSKSQQNQSAKKMPKSFLIKKNDSPTEEEFPNGKNLYFSRSFHEFLFLFFIALCEIRSHCSFDFNGVIGWQYTFKIFLGMIYNISTNFNQDVIALQIFKQFKCKISLIRPTYTLSELRRFCGKQLSEFQNK